MNTPKIILKMASTTVPLEKIAAVFEYALDINENPKRHPGTYLTHAEGDGDALAVVLVRVNTPVLIDE